jgi:hypothetical protein
VRNPAICYAESDFARQIVEPEPQITITKSSRPADVIVDTWSVEFTDAAQESDEIAGLDYFLESASVLELSSVLQ